MPAHKGLRIIIGLLLSILTGILLILSFNPGTPVIIVFIALVPWWFWLMYASPWEGLCSGWLTGGILFANLFSWGKVFGLDAWIGLFCYESFWFALFGLITAWSYKRYRNLSRWSGFLLAPLLWLTLDWLRASGPLGIGWGSLGYAFYGCANLRQIASLTGFYGLTWLCACLSQALALSCYKLASPGGIKTRQWAGNVSLSLVLLAGFWWFGRAETLHKVPVTATFPADIAQINMDQSLKWDQDFLNRNLDLVAQAVKRAKWNKAKMIIFPETSIPARFNGATAVENFIYRLARESGLYLLFGAPRETQGKLLNAVLLVSPAGTLVQEYAKMHLVPFGEYLPLASYLRKFKIFDRVPNFSPGENDALFSIPWGNFGALVCFESNFPALARQKVAKGAQFLVVLTNDAWFGLSSAAQHHIMWDVMRAVENRTYVLQSANTGISAVIDAYGELHKATALFTPAQFTAAVGLPRKLSFYTRWGDIFLYLCFLMLAILAAGEEFKLLSRRKI